MTEEQIAKIVAAAVAQALEQSNGNVDSGNPRLTARSSRDELLPNRQRTAIASFKGVKRGSPTEKAMHKVNALGIGEQCTFSTNSVSVGKLFGGLRFQKLHYAPEAGGRGRRKVRKGHYVYKFHRDNNAVTRSGEPYVGADLDVTVKDDTITVKRIA